MISSKQIAEKFTHRRIPYDGFFKDLAEYLKVDPNHPKLNKLWSIAWEEKHSYGVEEVVWFCLDLVDLIE